MVNSRVDRLSESNLNDFWTVHSQANGMAECYCAFWWTDFEDDWDKRTPEDNKALRREIFNKGIYDGYLLYVDNQPAGWCQVIQRDRLSKLTRNFELQSDESIWTISCFFIAKNFRRQGMAEFLLREVMADLKARQVEKLEAYPRHGEITKDDELWSGPQEIFKNAGFECLKTGKNRIIMSLKLQE